MIWFPTAFLDDNISFEPIDDEAARVTLTDGCKSVSATMYFDEEGKVTDFVAKRYRTVEGGYDLENVVGTGLRVRGACWPQAPAARRRGLEASGSGDLKYADITITHLEYDIA